MTRIDKIYENLYEFLGSNNKVITLNNLVDEYPKGEEIYFKLLGIDPRTASPEEYDNATNTDLGVEIDYVVSDGDPGDYWTPATNDDYVIHVYAISNNIKLNKLEITKYFDHEELIDFIMSYKGNHSQNDAPSRAKTISPTQRDPKQPMGKAIRMYDRKDAPVRNVADRGNSDYNA